MVGYLLGPDINFRGYWGWLMSVALLSGLKAWVIQRASAIYLLLFVIFMPVVIFSQKINSFHAWQEFIAEPMITVSCILFFASLFAHAWVGIRDIIVDYVSSFKTRLVLLSALVLYLIVMMFWVLRILLLSTGAIA